MMKKDSEEELAQRPSISGSISDNLININNKVLKSAENIVTKRKQQIVDNDMENDVSMNSVLVDSGSGSGRSDDPKFTSFPIRTGLTFVLLLFLTIFTTVRFSIYAMKWSERTESKRFKLRASELTNEIQAAFRDYEVAGRWIQEACGRGGRGIGNSLEDQDTGQLHLHPISHSDFQELYEFVHSENDGLDFHSAQCAINITHAQRHALEENAMNYYNENYPNFTYRGIVGLEPVAASTANVTDIVTQSRSEQPFYFPVHFAEPVVGNEESIDFDLYSCESQRRNIEVALETWQPVITPPSPLIVNDTIPSAYSVQLIHPGVKLPTRRNPQYYLQRRPRELGLVVVSIPALLIRAAQSQLESLAVYIFDSTTRRHESHQHYAKIVHEKEAHEYLFLGGAIITAGSTAALSSVTFVPEIGYSELKRSIPTSRRLQEERVSIVQNHTWSIVVVALPGTFRTNKKIDLHSSITMLVTCICFVLFVYTNMRRVTKIKQLKLQSKRDKAAMIIQAAKNNAKMERNLNDFIAHEVRNPLAAALSACTFVASEINGGTNPLSTEQSKRAVREDVAIINSSLQFMNDLLRNMLDMHRAANNQLNIQIVPVDVLHDILEPVCSMLYLRNEEFDVILECDNGHDNIIVMADKLRLKQVVLNLSRNAAKFVQKGYIKLRCAINTDTGNVCLFVEDSGCGIPKHKQNRLFSKYQERLDTLNQGSGIGLCFCEKLVHLMGGTIWLDESFHSGIEKFPGTRFVIDLQRPSLSLAPYDQEEAINSSIDTNTRSNCNSSLVTKKPRLAGIDGVGESIVSDARKQVPWKQHDFSNDNDVEQGLNLKMCHQFGCLNNNSQQPNQQQQKCVLSNPENNELSSLHAAFTSSECGQQKVATQNDTNAMNESVLSRPLSVLFVDDDIVLRKLFSRSIRRVAPKWKIHEAANGETALRLCGCSIGIGKENNNNSSNKAVIKQQHNTAAVHHFDIIFIDQYMASIEKQLLGTETTRLLRSSPYNALPKNTIICGLSANDTKKAFLKAGADYFWCKPFPCRPDELKAELIKMLNSRVL